MDMHEATQNTESLEYEMGELNPDDLAAMSGGVQASLLGGFVQFNSSTSFDNFVPLKLQAEIPVVFGLDF